MARPLHCGVDPDIYYPEPCTPRWDLGYMGTYSADRHATLERLMLEPARHWRPGRFVVAGAQYPEALTWPNNVKRVVHLPPSEHRAFYNGQRFTLNVTRERMVEAGYSPSVRLFEAAACGTPIISDWWEGLDQFLTPGEEILVARSAADTLELLRTVSDAERRQIGLRARERVLREHTAAHRALELEEYAREVLGSAAFGR